MITSMLGLRFLYDKAGNYGVQKMQENYGTKKIEAISLGDNDANDYLKIKSVDEYRRFITNKVPFMLRG